MKSYRHFDTSSPVRLTGEEQELLLHIYRTRLRLFLSVFFFLVMSGIFYGQRIDFRGSNGQLDRYAYKPVDAPLSRWQMKAVGVIWLELPILTIGLIIFRRRIHALKKDLREGMKYAINHTVTFKQHFPATGQYFISLDDPDYMHHEVDESTYLQVSAGDAFPVYFARYSRYAFNKNGRYTVI